MSKTMFRKATVYLIDGTPIVIKPLKIAYLKEVMERFEDLKNTQNEDESMDVILDCILVCMKQFYPKIDTREHLADSIDMNALYVILDYAANIALDPNKSKSIEAQAEEELTKEKDSQENQSWEKFDLVKYEMEAFLLGMWKSVEELEYSISLPELTEILSANSEKEYNNRRFFAAIQGIDMDGNKEEEDPWEAMKSRVAEKTSGIKTTGSNDITSFQGVKARQAGFGIGMGLDYEKMD